MSVIRAPPTYKNTGFFTSSAISYHNYHNVKVVYLPVHGIINVVLSKFLIPLSL